jgi:(R,R)-butanediol dehydrogenase/meso-butanediol dehydrogenase/diacetyl reductase
VRDHAATIKLVREVNLAPFIAGRIALDDLISEGFDALIKRNETAVKIIVHP